MRFRATPASAATGQTARVRKSITSFAARSVVTVSCLAFAGRHATGTGVHKRMSRQYDQFRLSISSTLHDVTKGLDGHHRVHLVINFRIGSLGCVRDLRVGLLPSGVPHCRRTRIVHSRSQRHRSDTDGHVTRSRRLHFLLYNGRVRTNGGLLNINIRRIYIGPLFARSDTVSILRSSTMTIDIGLRSRTTSPAAFRCRQGT